MAAHAHEKWKRLGDGSLQGQDFEEGLGHLLDLGVLRNVLLALLVLTVVTVAVSRFDFGYLNLVVAMVIATVKAGIVATFFMHLKFEGKVILMYVFYPLIILFILIGGSYMDVAAREVVHPSHQTYEMPKMPVPAIGHHDEQGKHH